MKDHIYSCPIIGAYMAASLLKEAKMLFYSPAGCEKNVLHTMSAHDIIGFDKDRIYLNQIGDAEAIFGGEDKLKEQVKDILDEDPGCHLFVISSCVPEIIGEDSTNVLKGIDDSRITILDTAGFKGDLWKGYSETLASLTKTAGSMAFRGTKEDPKLPFGPETESMKTPAIASDSKGSRISSSALIGYLYDRKEYDHKANIRILKEMFSCAGIRFFGTMMEPSSLTDLRRILEADMIFYLEFGELAAKEIRSKSSMDPVRLELPVGLEFTTRFIRRIAEICLGLSGSSSPAKDAAEQYIHEQLDAAVPLIAKIRDVFRMKRVMIFSDSQVLPGLLDFTIDLGMIPVSAVSHNNSPSINKRIKEALGDDFDECMINPSPDAVEGALDRADLIIGTQVEKYKYGKKVPVFEFGFPCYDRHCIRNDPFIGYEGAVNLAQNLANFIGISTKRFFGIKNEIEKLGFTVQPFFKRQD